MLVLCLLAGITGAPSAALATGEKWTKPQQEVADVFATWAAAELAADVEREMNLMAPTFTAWDFAQPAPMDRAAYRQLTIDLFKQAKVVDMAITPMSIQVDRRTAVAHGRYAQTFQDAAGARKSVQGPWTASLIREGNKWLVLGIGWTEDRPAIDEAAMREQVSGAATSFRAACESADPTTRLAFLADVPEFRYVDHDGKQYDYATLQKLMQNVTEPPSIKVTTATAEIFPLAPDRALELWTGAVDITRKDGPMLHADPYHAAFVWQRMGETWKIVTRVDSSLPFAAAAPAAVTHRAPGEVAMAMTKPFNAHDVAAVMALYAADPVSIMSGIPDPVRGREAKEAMLTRTFHALPDLKLDITLSATSGENVICAGTFSGTNTGTWITPEGEKPATGRAVSLPVSIILTIGPDGLVTTEHIYFNAAKYRQQLFGEAGG
jgi:ketosteroid isomerase-like protein